MFPSLSSLRTNGCLGLLLALAGTAGAAGSPVVEQAMRLLAALEPGGAPNSTQSPAVQRAAGEAKQALQKADARANDPTPKHRELLQQSALGWAELGRDLQRASESEQAADKLESELSSVQTDLVRTHASVEQAMARLGRVREELKALSRSPALTPETPPATSAPPAAPAPGSRRGGG